MTIAPLIEPAADSNIADRLRRQLDSLMTVDKLETSGDANQVVGFYGQLLDTPEVVFEQATERFATLGYTAMLLEEKGVYRILAVQGVSKPQPGRRWVNILLFVLTFITMALSNPSPDMDTSNPMWYLSGLPFALALMAILLAHELAHYFVARRYGSPVSLPYFIPLIPGLNPFGTMGAVIFQRAPMRDRKALFDIGIAGPLAGFVVAIPLLIGGLFYSQIGRPSDFIELREDDQILQEGNSLVYLAAKYIVFGRVLPGESGEDVWLSLPASPGGPIAFAAWAGLLVTALNLLPIGQYDGGHVAYAILGRWAWRLAYLTIGLLGVLGLYFIRIGNPAALVWLIWMLFGLFVGPRHPPPLNDVSRIGRTRVLLGILLAVIFVIIFVPVPMLIVPAH